MADVTVFTAQEREQIREELVAAAKADSRIGAAAHLGSAALGRVDRWSDIDLALCLAPGADFNQVLDDWTARLDREHGVAARYDVRRGEILYRVFLLEDTLQIDLSFWPCGELRAVGPKFKLIFGTVGDAVPSPVPNSKDLIGMAWLYALHVRSSIARGRFLQAEQMLNGMRDNVLALACRRCGVDAVQGRGLDDLPEDEKTRAAESRAGSLERDELRRAFRMTTEVLLEELRRADSVLEAKIRRPLNIIADSAGLLGSES
jgi:hypothetical protein